MGSISVGLKKPWKLFTFCQGFVLQLYYMQSCMDSCIPTAWICTMRKGKLGMEHFYYVHQSRAATTRQVRQQQKCKCQRVTHQPASCSSVTAVHYRKCWKQYCSLFTSRKNNIRIMVEQKDPKFLGTLCEAELSLHGSTTGINILNNTLKALFKHVPKRNSQIRWITHRYL